LDDQLENSQRRSLRVRSPSIRWLTLHHDANNGRFHNFIGPNTHGTLVYW
jgi:hypothetical protein